MLPPPSVAVAIAAMPVASATADPPEEPPQVRSGFHGLRVVPNRSFDVKPSAANSGRFVLPTTMAPAARRRATTTASVVAAGADANIARPERGPHARDIGHVLHEQRQPGERPGLRPRGELLVEHPRLRERLRSQRDHRAEVGVERFDPPERPRDEFVRADLTRADLRGELAQRRHRRANMPSSS